MTLAPFVRTDRGLHPTIDRDALLAFYRDLPLRVDAISSPSELVAWEVLREQHRLQDEDAVPCDIFLWGNGTAPDPRLTRVGGVPFMPRSMEWPRIGDSIPVFLCQFNFCDSRDLVGETPGDILLVFAEHDNSALEAAFGPPHGLRFRWVSADSSDVIDARHVPEPTYPFDRAEAWGVRHRTYDAPAKWDLSFALCNWFDRIGTNAGDVSRLPALRASKIGGLPHHSQELQRAVPEHYLCQLVSIQVYTDTAWPWVDREEPLDRRQLNFADDLLIGDGGELTLFLRPDGSIDVDAAC